MNCLRIPLRSLLGAGVLLLAACSSDSTGSGGRPAVATVTVTPALRTLTVGDTVRLTATVKDAARNVLKDRAVTWVSSNPSVATVSASGLVNGVQADSMEATITATCEQVSGSAVITVHLQPVASVTVAPNADTILFGDTVRLAATVKDSGGHVLTDRAVEWISSNPSVATVSATGLVTGLEPNLPAVTITATAGRVSGTSAITVAGTVPSQGGLLSVSAGGLHTCGLNASGTAYCWGSGPLGHGSTASSTVPVPVFSTLRFSTVTAGNFLACGITTIDGPYCWGEWPVTVAGGHEFVALTIGDGLGPGHYCGLTANGAAYCWGNNSYGQVGDSTTSGDQIQNGWQVRTTPVAVVGGLSFAALTAGVFHTCGLTSNGAAYCWGNNESGQLGNGSTAMFSAVPVAVAGGLRFVGLSAGASSTCGVTTSGAAYCWGPNGWGQLGDGSTTPSLVPVAVTGGFTFSVVTTGGGHSCGLATSRAAYCWGWNSSGQLGTGDETGPEKDRCYQQLPCSTRPVAVAGGLSFVTLSAGGQTSCGIAQGGIAYCWGDNRYGQVGDGTTTSSSVPVRVAGQGAGTAAAVQASPPSPQHPPAP